MSALPALPRRERLLLAATLCGVALLAWGYLLHEAQRMNNSDMSQCFRMKMSAPEFTSWPAATLLPLFVMWAVMMIAMMLPSALPMILTFAAVARNRRRLGRPYVPVAVFAFGYIAVWLLFSALAAVTQWLLHRHALLSPAMMIPSAWLGGAVLLGAGLFQFTPLKRACLSRCRGPLEFIMTRWRDSRGGALRMGIEHGLFCTGCCWALMALLFVAGVMNILWVAALSLLVCLEKVLPGRGRMSAAVGLLLTGWGVFVLWQG